MEADQPCYQSAWQVVGSLENSKEDLFSQK